MGLLDSYILLFFFYSDVYVYVMNIKTKENGRNAISFVSRSSLEEDSPE